MQAAESTVMYNRGCRKAERPQQKWEVWASTGFQLLLQQ